MELLFDAQLEGPHNDDFHTGGGAGDEMARRQMQEEHAQQATLASGGLGSDQHDRATTAQGADATLPAVHDDSTFTNGNAVNAGRRGDGGRMGGSAENESSRKRPREADGDVAAPDGRPLRELTEDELTALLASPAGRKPRVKAAALNVRGELRRQKARAAAAAPAQSTGRRGDS